MPYQRDVEVRLLIGANYTYGIKPREIIRGAAGDPYAVKKTFGWGIIGNAHPLITDCYDRTTVPALSIA